MTHGTTRMHAAVATCTLLLAIAANAGAAAEVYRCTVDGRVTFTDRPCADGERIEGLPAATPRPQRPPAGDPGAQTPSDTPAGLPRFDAWTTGEHPDVVRAMADLGRRCAAGDARACQTHRLNRTQYDGNRDRNRRCADGDVRACDEIRCLANGDRAACARVD